MSDRCEFYYDGGVTSGGNVLPTDFRCIREAGHDPECHNFDFYQRGWILQSPNAVKLIEFETTGEDQ